MTLHRSRPAIQSTLAVVLAGGRGSRLGPLTEGRAKPAVPFGGKLKIIDFALSNCVNSGLRQVIVLTQYKAQSLIRHVERGWNFLTPQLGEFIDVVPAQQQQGEHWYSGTANAVWQNLDLIRRAAPAHVLVLAGDHVYKMDYATLLAEHIARRASATVACIDVPLADAPQFGVVGVDALGRVTGFEEKPTDPMPMPGCPDRALASMGIYLFDTEALVHALERDAADPHSSHDFGLDLLPALTREGRLMAHDFRHSCVNLVGDRPYWRDVGTLDAYYAANMDLTHVVPELNLYDVQWPIISLEPHLPPAKFVFDEADRRGQAIDALVCGGCIVSGSTVRRSILFAQVRVGERSLIEDSLLLPRVTTGQRVRLSRAIVDKLCHLPDDFEAGVDPAADRDRGFLVTPAGITLVTAAMLGQPPRGA